jgi:hypothetical protein
MKEGVEVVREQLRSPRLLLVMRVEGVSETDWQLDLLRKLR